MIITEPVSVELDLSKKYVRDLKTNTIYKIDTFDKLDNTVYANEEWYALDWRSFAYKPYDLSYSAHLVDFTYIAKYAFELVPRSNSRNYEFFGEQCG